MSFNNLGRRHGVLKVSFRSRSVSCTEGSLSGRSDPSHLPASPIVKYPKAVKSIFVCVSLVRWSMTVYAAPGYISRVLNPKFKVSIGHRYEIKHFDAFFELRLRYHIQDLSSILYLIS